MKRHQGAVVKHTGDGVLATFPSSAQAIAAAFELPNSSDDLGLATRTGIHVGDVELRNADIGGLAVHLAARVMSEAQPGEILASSTAAQSALGTRYHFEDRGMKALRRMADRWQLLAVQPRNRPA